MPLQKMVTASLTSASRYSSSSLPHKEVYPIDDNGNENDVEYLEGNNGAVDLIESRELFGRKCGFHK